MILTHLQTDKSITPLKALKEYGVYRLSDTIFQLREKFDIKTKQESTLNRFNKVVKYAKYIYVGVKEEKTFKIGAMIRNKGIDEEYEKVIDIFDDGIDGEVLLFLVLEKGSKGQIHGLYDYEAELK